MRERALGELSGFAPFNESVAGICTKLLIRIRTLPFTIGVGIGFVTSCAEAVLANSRHTANATTGFMDTLILSVAGLARRGRQQTPRLQLNRQSPHPNDSLAAAFVF